MRASMNGKATPHAAQVIAALTALATALAPRAGEAQVPAEVTSDPDAASWSAGRVDLFARAQDNTLWHQWWDANRWNGPESLGGGLLSAPGVTSSGVNQLHAFVQGANNTLCQKWWDGQRWSEWIPLGGAGQITSAPAAASWGGGRVDVFARGNPDGLWHMWFDGRWLGPENLGGGLIGGPAASTWGANRLDTFVRGTNNALHHRWYDGQWHDWESLTGANTMTSDPAAVSWGRDRIDVFYRGADNTVQQVWWDGTAWRGPVSLGGAATSGPTASSQGPNRLEVFVRGDDNRTWRRAWDGTAWDTWARVPAPQATPLPVPPDPNATTITITPPPSIGAPLKVNILVREGSSVRRGYCGTVADPSVWRLNSPNGVLGCTVTVPRGAEISLEADEFRRGYAFDGWTGCSGTVRGARGLDCSFSAQESVTLTPRYTQVGTVTVTLRRVAGLNGTGWLRASNQTISTNTDGDLHCRRSPTNPREDVCTGSFYTRGTSLRVWDEAINNMGQRVREWFGACAGQPTDRGECRVTLDGDVEVWDSIR